MFERTPGPWPGPDRRRQSRPGLTHAAVVAAGRAVIERGGLDALTMRAVAAELSTAPASLYRHVADRDALLLAMLEQIASGLPVEVPGTTPHDRLLRRLLDAHGHLSDHVWVLHLLIGGEAAAENAMAFTDACLADFLAAGLTPRAAMAAYRSGWQLVLGELLEQHPIRPAPEPDRRQRAPAAVDPQRLPALDRCSREAPDAAGREREFARSLDALLVALLAGAGAPVDRSGGPQPPAC
ncbi:TetR/AcrR family transcriptional regulator [Streptacidiphilus sp. PB12-B1b]|uniref:TetR/AcrR family transcriptional regulator n=1 Tax=Streptacidiphilus sp. PB12-B1b TaxID=2705012 RepID=UPI0015F94CE3|nr:TetR/AcrR family transcriptional regulator [Streptacidiphilus sp. PB12-B1b]QMU77825.1 TetR/AcrR family transcriptional regulator [Streptacidiphilus sp. PB12-B1b]